MSEKLKWHESYRIGTTLGTVLLAGGAALIIGGVYKSADATFSGGQLASMFVGGALGTGGGLYLSFKSYKKDPIYRQKQINAFKQCSFKDSLKKLGWEDLLLMIPAEEIQTKLFSEIKESDGLETIWVMYDGVDFAKKMLYNSVLDTKFFVSKFETDNQTSKSSLVKRLSSYGQFLVEDLHVDREVLACAVESDPQSRLLSFSSISQMNGRLLYQLRLLHKPFLQEKCLQELESRGFKNLHISCGNWFIDDDIVPLNESAIYFRSYVMNLGDIIELFENYWEWPILFYGDKIGINNHEFQTLQQLHNTYTRAKQSYTTSVQAVKNEYDNTIKHYEKKYYELKEELSTKLDRLKFQLENITDENNKKKTVLTASIEKLNTETELKLAEALSDKLAQEPIAASKRDTSLARLQANWNDILNKLQNNWFKWKKGEPINDINIAFAGSTEINTNNVVSSSSSTPSNQNVNIVVQAPPVQQQPQPQIVYVPAPVGVAVQPVYQPVQVSPQVPVYYQSNDTPSAPPMGATPNPFIQPQN
eukprot:TRINITY_DN5497_c0_g1_i1.p1 TRINITY_DN5497_c0_g1~~TRINITY_DN5497_c0_g1_i1.p1  ORF type:complete len:533 (+),score=129.98 TRINITY_DN5497_c0_g1_i1:57-1655(+)